MTSNSTHPGTASEQPLAWVQLARVLAALAVVLLHVSAVVMVNPGNAQAASWLVATFFNSLTRWAVPVFFMLSGGLVLPKVKNLTWQQYHQFLARRWRQLGWPTVAWTLFFLWFSHRPVSIWLQTIVFDQPFEHLYFLFALAELYLLAPVLAKLYHRFAEWTLIASVLLTFFWPGTRFLGLVFVPYISYFLLGHWLMNSRTWLRSSHTPRLLGVGWSLTTLAIFLATAYLTLIIKVTKNLAWTDYQHPVVMAQAVCALGLFWASHQRLKKASSNYLRRLETLSATTLGIFILHPVGVKVSASFLSQYYEWSWATIPLATTAIFACCGVVTLVIKKNPLIKRLL